MAECVHCEREIVGTPEEKTLTVDESVGEIPPGEAVLKYCSGRCFRDWLEGLVGLEPVFELERELAVSQSGGKDD